MDDYESPRVRKLLSEKKALMDQMHDLNKKRDELHGAIGAVDRAIEQERSYNNR